MNNIVEEDRPHEPIDTIETRGGKYYETCLRCGQPITLGYYKLATHLMFDGTKQRYWQPVRENLPISICEATADGRHVITGI